MKLKEMIITAVDNGFTVKITATKDVEVSGTIIEQLDFQSLVAKTPEELKELINQYL